MKNLINNICSNIPSLFSPNELAYLTVQCKNEIQIRDRIACKMQNDLDAQFPGKYVVRREWSDSSRSKVDLAVLELDNMGQFLRVTALIEFKAHSILNDEGWPYAEFLKDVLKMKNICYTCTYADNNTQMYFIYLHSHQDISNLSVDTRVVNYYKLVQKSQVHNSDPGTYMKALWDDFFINPYILNSNKKGISKYKKYVNTGFRLTNSLQTPTPSLQRAGTCFGVEVYISPMVWGPVRRNEIR